MAATWGDNDDADDEGRSVSCASQASSIYSAHDSNRKTEQFELNDNYAQEMGSIPSAAQRVSAWLPWEYEVSEQVLLAEEEACSQRKAFYQTSSDSFNDAKRRSSDTPTRAWPQYVTDGIRRSNSMTAFCRIRGHLKAPAFVQKAPPASPALTACTVHVFEPPRLDTVYEDATNLLTSHVPRQTAQTIQSDYGMYQILWEEPSMYWAESPEQESPHAGEENRHAPPSPRMERVKIKLAAWRKRSLAHLNDDHERQHRWLPLLDTNERRRRGRSSDPEPGSGDDGPVAPPNTARDSLLSSAKPSLPHSPANETADDDSSEGSPLLLDVNGILGRPHTAQPTRSSTPRNDFHALPRRSSLPPSPSIPRQLSELATGDLRFRSHRDSVEITHGHLMRHQIEGGHMNQHLMNSQDSFVLTKSKLKTRDAAHRESYLGPSVYRVSVGGLSPILDSSPPRSGEWERYE
ncbi:hypothetical protein CLAFUW4_11672 [Fulvia fulva]|uniref:Uncharacterized protein n=1 Tax=Passalora fulva TaxID=5499 RepID=A0A9Q8PC95_PASFU|nr:uncharacterized protein CLAFUR5_10719 [Fulvia fulva]KAK4619311.1 hypothetical protein CLAFUR4_11677 [Fulvia fulva]KAK4620669.1 hypothetical protein CLAFUR0_11689 [Fulvia fulva]UJO19742.1 hypothetical protein CLAFUR5_10719 [Fulvia fulva]WPV17174.1 hypothetical protein CLAFUW4_11672 [Fulvia fulva]WPV32165.1 hypothetical protein CLAFUW7_11679 [Fulvia fulva]